MRHHWTDYVTLLGRDCIERELDIHRTTLCRWLDGTVKIPTPARLMIEMLGGNLPGTQGEWEGWRFYKGELCSPEGYTFHSGDLYAIRYERAQIASLQQALKEAEAKIAALSVDPFVREKAANDAADFIPDEFKPDRPRHDAA